MGKGPWDYLDAVLRILSTGKWDILFPTHEQAFLFARERARIPGDIGLAVADFGSFLQIQGKAALVRTLERLSIPQPASQVIRTTDELRRECRFPFYLKADYATASTAVWRIEGARDLESKIETGDGVWVVQEPAAGILERVQAVFESPNGWWRCGVLPPDGGGHRRGDISKLAVHRPCVRDYVERLGGALRWHGALSLDYIVERETGTPLFIDANPRLVEPMNAVFGGINLADILARISTGEPIATTEPARARPSAHICC